MRQFTAVIHKGEKYYVALCPELDVASQGVTIEESRTNLADAVALFLEVASPSEIRERLHSETYITQLEVPVGPLTCEAGS